MALHAGVRLGPYEILDPLGAGGMGEVYRARDTRLDRIVALKVLPPSLASDPQFRERFEREARAISALEHPHICALYDVGDARDDASHAEPVQFLVMQYLEGETLESRLAKGPLPVAQALTVAIQIADALATAHRAGIVHRDLKPGNVILTKSGARLLDFGLAKINAPVIAVTGTMLPTTPAAVTAQGTILGTFQYMAPEQIEGLEADARTDIFAFGALFYEMLTGNRAFEGKTRASLIGAILKDEPPPVSRVQTLAPASLDRIIATCLAKDPDDRWQSARDLLRELKWVAAPGPAATPVVTSSPPPSRRRVFVSAGAGLIAGTAVTALATWALLSFNVQSPQTIRLEFVPPPAESLLTATPDRHIAISPDGSRIVYGGGTNPADARLFLRRLDQLESESLGVVGVWPFFSPDGRWIGFFGGGELQKVSVTGGTPIPLCRYTGFARGAVWSADGTILFATSDLTTGLLAVPQGGGEPTVLTKPDNAHGEADHITPALLPDGRVLFTLLKTSVSSGVFTSDDSEIVALDRRTGARTTLAMGGSQAAYVEPGYVIYAMAGTLRAVRVDSTRGSNSDAVPVVEQVRGFASGAAEYAISRQGTLVYVPGNAATSQRSLVWVDRNGVETPINAPLRAYDMARLSPDGTRIALQVTEKDADIWIWDLSRETLTSMARMPGVENLPVWMPDGRHIVFSSTQSGPRNLYRMAADGTGMPERLTTTDNNQFPFSVTPDGSRLMLGEVAPQTQADVRMVDLSGPAASGRRSEVVVQTAAREFGPQISPDGRWLVYQSEESGQMEIYVRPFPDVDRARVLVSTAGGTRAVWSRSGRELFYLDNDGFLMGVTIAPNSQRFSAGSPQRILKSKYYSGFNLAAFDVAPDGQRFLMIKEQRAPGEPIRQDRIVIVLNWLEDLKRRMQAQ